MKRSVVGILIALTFVLLGLCGCGTSKNEQIKIARLQSFLQEKRSPVSALEYRVMPPDVLVVSSRTVREISNITQQIRPDGKITMPLLGDLFVAGLTPDEIQKEIAKSAQKFYKKVDVTVFVVGYNSQHIYVFGEVAGPGPLPWTGSDTLLDVLSRVQPTLNAWPEKIKVIRACQPRRGGYLKGDQLEGMSAEQIELANKNGAQELTVDLMAMVKSGDMSHNIMLQPDDVIYVPTNPFVATGRALDQILFPTRPVVEGTAIPSQIDDNVYMYWKERQQTLDEMEYSGQRGRRR
jgi:polysaccharide export outer membrane protein